MARDGPPLPRDKSIGTGCCQSPRYLSQLTFPPGERWNLATRTDTSPDERGASALRSRLQYNHFASIEYLQSNEFVLVSPSAAATQATTSRIESVVSLPELELDDRTGE